MHAKHGRRGISWEFISKLNFEWSIFRGRRKRNWTAAVRDISRSYKGDFLMEKRYPRQVIHILSCDHAGGGRGTDDGLQHNESDQLQGIVVRSKGSACSHTLPPDMADHCAGRSLERPGVSATLRNPADICEYFNDVSSGALWAAKVGSMVLAYPSA